MAIMDTLQLKDLLLIIRKRFCVIIFITLAATILSAIISFFVLKPVYQSDTSLYIGKNENNQGAIVYNDLLLNNQLVNDYRELVKSRMITGIVLEKLGFKDMTVDQLSGKLSVVSKQDTRLIVISARDEDPKRAKDIANTVAEVFREKVVEIMKVENVQVIDKAEEPAAPIKPDKKMNVSIAALLGLMLGFGIVLLIEYLDDTIKTPEDVQKYIGLTVIGTIPEFREE